MNEDARREAFIRAAATEMLTDMRISSWSSDMMPGDELGEWLRTVWLEARGEPWGEDVEVGSGAEVIITDEGVSDG